MKLSVRLAIVSGFTLFFVHVNYNSMFKIYKRFVGFFKEEDENLKKNEFENTCIALDFSHINFIFPGVYGKCIV